MIDESQADDFDDMVCALKPSGKGISKLSVSDMLNEWCDLIQSELDEPQELFLSDCIDTLREDVREILKGK